MITFFFSIENEKSQNIVLVLIAGFIAVSFFGVLIHAAYQYINGVSSVNFLFILN